MTRRARRASILRMQLREVDEAGYRIYLGALESPRGDGFTAAVAVQCLGADAGAPPPFRDDRLACGHRWPTAEEALAFALRRGRAWVRAQGGRCPRAAAATSGT
jgi:hypothetical protein